MTVDASTIRAQRFSEIGKIVRRDASLVIERWAKRVAVEQPKARRVHHDVLLDDLPNLLHELGTRLEREGNPDHCPQRGPARRHGEQRWENGWSVGEVVRDYRILRLVLLDYLDEVLDRPLQLEEVQAVGLELDEAIESSIEKYAASRDGQLGELEASLRRQSDALREVDRRKNEFLATLAHELLNPLAPLRNSLEVVRLGGDSPEAVRQVREMMERQIRQMTRLVDDLLDVSRIAQGKLVLRAEPVDLRAVVEQAVPMNAPLVQLRRHRMSVHLPEGSLWVKGDQARLIQVFVNLFNNAAKYTPEGGEIHVRAAREGSEAVVSVSDNGLGIPAEMLPHIFELFTQLDVGTARSQGGLGIGLTLVRRLVELHQGTITATSGGPGKGSQFVVRLPAVEPEANSDCSTVPAARSTGKRHVVIVEDNPDGRESLAQLLRLLGHRVEVAEDGIKGVERALASRPEIALVDIGLPGLDGYEVATRIRAALGSAIYLVALTGHSQPEDRERALAAGFDSHLVKPVDLEDLQQTLQANIGA